MANDIPQVHIPQAILDRLDALERLTATQAPVSARMAEEHRLTEIRRKSIFAGLGEPVPNKIGPYAVRLYRATTQKNPDGTPIVAVGTAYSEGEKATMLADGWFTNAEGRK